MGKATGFMDYQRVENAERNPAERIADYEEFHIGLNEKSRIEQSGRCMDCGVPFCQAPIVYHGQRQGCPLRNLIPEWNDMLWSGNKSHALSRLLKMNCFPEFTGRVCPALCEKACTCHFIGEPVTIRDNELYLIEFAFENGFMVPHPPQTRSGKKIAVIGSGPAGLAAAHYLNRRGHEVTVFERDQRPGGLLMYGIPNMKLPKEIVERRIRFMEQEGIVFRTGVDVGRDLSAAELQDQFDAVILCCGAQKPREVPFEGTVENGICYALDYLKSATLALQKQPHADLSAAGKKVVVVGAGDSASDCVATAIRQGCEDLVQMIRKPASWYKDTPEDYAHAEAYARFGRDVRLFESRVTEVLPSEAGNLEAVIFTTANGEQEMMEADLLIIASGFSGCEDYITAFSQEFHSDKGVFVAGDMKSGSSLVVLAMADGKQAAIEADKYLMGYTNME